MRIIPIRKFSLIGAFSNGGQPVANKIQVSFNIDEKNFTHEIYIVKNLSYEMILGVDFLSEQTITIRCGKSFAIEFPEREVKKF